MKLNKDKLSEIINNTIIVQIVQNQMNKTNLRFKIHTEFEDYSKLNLKNKYKWTNDS